MRLASALAALLVAATAPACSGEKPQTGADDQAADLLLACNKERDRLKTGSDMCAKQLDEARAQPTSREIVVRLEGDILNVYGDLRGASMPAEDATQLSDSLIGQVRASRQAIQQCYVTAMKKDESIQARTIKGKVVVQVSVSGAVTGASFSPSISSDFATCIRKVATRWKVPAYKEARTVEVPVTLQPG